MLITLFETCNPSRIRAKQVRLVSGGRFVPLFLVAVATALPATAQQGIPFPPENTVLIGVGGLPGLGAMAGYVAPARMYTREAVVYGDVIPSIRGRDGSAYVAVVIGGALRIIGTGETLGFIPPKKYDIDIGIRLGPSLVFEFEESRADKNKRFNVAAEPFLRFARKLGKQQRTFFAEGGLIRPTLRFGIWIGM